jgi:diguanylate cyclase (GGDEF)-like protein
MGGLYIKNNTEKWLYNNNIENTNLMLRQTAEYVDDCVLKHMKNLIAMIAIDDRVINVDSEINSYIDFDANTFEFRTKRSESEIMSFFRSIKETQDVVSLVSFGTEEGGYIEYPTFKPNEPYDPRVRDWYKDAILQNQAIISEPYMTKVTKDLVISVDQAVISNDKKIGVVSLSIKLDDLIKHLNAFEYGKTGYINILSANNTFISSPKNEDWVLHSIQDLNIDTFDSIDQYNGKSFEGQIDAVDKVFNVYISPYSGWKYISVIDKGEVLEQSRVLTNFLLFIYLVTFLIVLLLIFVISNYITKPILSIAHVINKMSTFKFDLYEHKNFEIYTHQKDEIGEISRALSRMQENFIELKNNIDVMDEEIQNINIDEKSIYQLSLSKDNPFDGITSSVNGLLKRVNSYIEQIKLFGDEISCKNDLLISSEEELIAQIEEINAQKEHINFLAYHDSLTNLPNRRSLYVKLKKALENNSIGAVLLIDLDNFKGINDSLGHSFGDKVLQYISSKLEKISSESVFVSRFGGDEFLILYECEKSQDEIVCFIERIFLAFSDAFIIDDNKIKIGISMGVSVFPSDSQNIHQLIMNADLAMYTIKNTGKNNYAFFNSTMAEHLEKKLNIKAILMESMANNGFKMVYQPQVDIHSGEIKGYEGLIRLKNYNLSPAEFIHIAEENGMIIPIGRMVTKMVVEQMHLWMEKGFDLKPVSINFSAIQIQDTNYKTYLFDLLKENDINPQFIVIEITENIFMEYKETTIAFLNELRVSGIKIAVDDFGTGFSSLSYLTFLPIDIIKLDRMLGIKFLELENSDFMNSLIALAHSLKLTVVAEGIEDFDKVQKLISGKCDAIQGYYFSKPLEVEDVERNYNKIYDLGEPMD